MSVKTPPAPPLPILSVIPTTSPASNYTTQERLLLSQAVYKLGALAWPAVSGLLLEHPCCVGRPEDLFSPKGCEDAYVGLMGSIDQNVPAQDAIKPRAKVHLNLAQTFYLLRMSELQNEIQSHEAKFVTLLSEINNLKSGQLDDTIRAELRGVLARKFGKRLLDSWVPEEGNVEAALEGGMPAADELKAEFEDKKGVEGAKKERVSVEGVNGVEEVGEEDEVVKEDTAIAQGGESPQDRSVEISNTETPAPAISNSPGAEVRSRSKRKASPTKTKSIKAPVEAVPEPPTTPAIEEEPTNPAEREQEEDEGVEEPLTTRSSKRKASHQPKGAPPNKKTGRKGAAKTPTPAPESDPEVADPAEDEKAEIDDEIAITDGKAGIAEEGVGKDQDELVQTEEERPNLRDRRSSRRTGRATSPNEKVDTPTPAEPEREEDDIQNTRGRRTSRRTGKASSPVLSISGITKGSSPAPSRRAPSASSTRSTPIPSATSRRASTRANRGVKDDEKSERVGRSRDSKTVESVKEEVEEDERPRRSTRRGRGDVEEEDTEPIEEVKSSRKSKDKGKDKKREEVEEEQEEDKEKESAPRRGKRGSIRTPIPTPAPTESNPHLPRHEDSEREQSVSVASVAEGSNTITGGRKPRYSSPRDARGLQKLILSLLDTICEHRNGNIFQGPVKKSEAKGYYDIIKRPMDLKAIRTRIRDGKISSIDEFERDILLMFANAMMYNSEGSQVWVMAQEMMRESEHHIARFRHMRHEMSK